MTGLVAPSRMESVTETALSVRWKCSGQWQPVIQLCSI